MENIILLADSYKVTHHLQYPPNTTNLYSYFESRGGKFDKTVFFGLQYILKKWLEGAVLTKQMIDEADVFFTKHFKTSNLFNRAGWEYILDTYSGRLPLRIRAVPEGTILPTRNVLFTVENTDPQVPWLANYFESLFVQAWYPITVATNSYYQKTKIEEYLVKTGDSNEKLPVMLHDFGFRGSTSVESAGIGGAGHLVNFVGSDNLAAIMTVSKYYSEDMAGFSIPATEHSTMTTWGREGETEAVRSILTRIPEGFVSVVADSYDLYSMLSNILGDELKQQVEERNGCLVVRPDSGEPDQVVLETLNILATKFGTRLNGKGYKVLPSYISVIQGDGICYETIEKILSRISEERWSAENLTFGSGGALLQKLNRDTQKCAYKCSYAQVNGEQRDVYKDPITDPGKRSKKGRLMLVKQDGDYRTVREDEANNQEDEMVLVFENGEMVKEWSFEAVRERASRGSYKS